MKKKYLLILSFAISIIGILILQLLSVYLIPPIIKIKEIDYSKSSLIRLTGRIESIKDTKNSKKLVLNDNSGKINIYVPNDNNFSINKSIEIIGKISEYNGFYQIFPEKIISFN